MKTYVLMISKHFMKGHPRAGEPTDFRQKIELGVMNKIRIVSTTTIGPGRRIIDVDLKEEKPKIHTIRENYDYWARVAEEVNSGRGILSLRQWTGSPYNYKRDGSKQKEFLQLTKMGVQRIDVIHQKALNLKRIWIDDKECGPDQRGLFKTNDGLSSNDFDAWFSKDLKRGTIIHFTDFRY